jgi:hypothetical protein
MPGSLRILPAVLRTHQPPHSSLSGRVWSSPHICFNQNWLSTFLTSNAHSQNKHYPTSRLGGPQGRDCVSVVILGPPGQVMSLSHQTAHSHKAKIVPSLSDFTPQCWPLCSDGHSTSRIGSILNHCPNPSTSQQ